MNKKEYAWFVGLLVAISFMAGLMFRAEIQQVFGATILTTNSTDTIGTFRTNVNTSLTNLNTQLLATVATATSLGDLAFYNSPLGVASGGTGATSAANARTNLGLGTGDSPTFTGVTATNATTTNLFATSFLFTSATGTDLTITNLKDANGTKYSTTSAANPTASIGLSTVNGSASTFMRSDAAPALDLSIAPTWTSLHQFSGAGVSSTQFRTPSATIQTLWDVHGNKYVTSSAASFTTTGGAPTLVGTTATSTTSTESQTGILYTGPSGQATSTQKLGTGYYFTVEAIQIVLFTGDASTTVLFQECSSSSYNDCTTKTQTASFDTTSTGGGAAFQNATFTTPYVMKVDKYYQYHTVYGNSLGRIQCGNTSAMSPIVGSDNDKCNAGSQAASFKLMGYTTLATVTGNNIAGTIYWGASTTLTMTFSTSSNSFAALASVHCVLDNGNRATTTNMYSKTALSTSSMTIAANASSSGYTSDYLCFGRNP